MLKIGLTGGIGSGKSTVSSLLKDKGFLIIDADIIAREITTLYPNSLKDIRREFGEQFFDDNGNLIRQKLGDYIFKYNYERRKLEEIMIPLIKMEILKQIHEYDKSGKEMCIVDAPTLIENNLHKDMDINILVWVDKNTQISRLRKRDNLNDEQINNRLNSQMLLDDKKKYVNFIIDNSSKISSTAEQVDSVMTILKTYYS